MPKLGIVVASTREGRAGLPIARWFERVARANAGFEVALLDLKEIGLPLLEEPAHPRLQQYDGGETHEKAARTMLDELVRWTTALAPLRA